MSFPGFPDGFSPGWWRIVTTSPPAVEPVSLAEAKQWARVERTDQDSMITDIIQMARERVEADLKRALITQSKTMYFMAFPWSGYYSLAIRGIGLNPWWFPFAQGVIQLPYPQLISVDSIQYVDTNGDIQTLSPSLYLYTANATPGRLQPVYGTVWPVARPQLDAVQISFTCGYGPSSSDVPASVRLAMRSLITASYANPEAFTNTGEIAISPLYRQLLATEDYGYYG